MLLTLTILALSTIPRALVLADCVDTADLNRVYDLDGGLVLTQWIFSDDEGRIMAWRLSKDEARNYRPPMLVWIDEGGRIRRLTAGSWVESFEQHDKEISQREVLPVTERRGLSKP